MRRWRVNCELEHFEKTTGHKYKRGIAPMNLADIRKSQATAKMGDAKRRKGRRTGREGRSLESLILASQTDVLLTKIPLSARRMPGGKIVACAGPVDFMGGYREDGRLIVFDAKQNKNPRRLPTGKKELREHQIEEIIRYGIAGFIAGLLCECSTTRTLYWCRWELLGRRRASIPWAEMDEIGHSSEPVNWKAIMREFLRSPASRAEKHLPFEESRDGDLHCGNNDGESGPI